MKLIQTVFRPCDKYDVLLIGHDLFRFTATLIEKYYDTTSIWQCEYLVEGGFKTPKVSTEKFSYSTAIFLEQRPTCSNEAN